MEINEFYEDYMDEVRSNALSNGLEKSQQFIYTTMERIVDYGDLDDFELLHYKEDFQSPHPLHAYYLDVLFNELTVVISLYNEVDVEAISNLTNSEIKAPFDRVTKFIKKVVTSDPKDVAESGSDLFHFASQIKNNWGQIKKIKVLFITNKPLSKRYEHKAQGSMQQKSVSIGIWDLRRLFEVELSGTEREEIKIDVNETPLSALKASESDKISSFLVVMPAKLLARIYGQYKSRVLEQNVRSFLQNKSNVNKGIRITLEQNPDRFFAYNNGITATAQQAEFNEEGQIINFDNLQIVNGGQTTAQIYNADKAGIDLSNISVQMKLNLIKSVELVDELVPKIAQFANSQNPVSKADLFSNDPYHRKIEQFSREIIPPVMEGNAFAEKWFYERSRGQYLNEQSELTSAQKREFQKSYPRSKLVVKTDLGLVLNSWNQLPHFVSKGAQANFKKFADTIDYEKNPNFYNEKYYKDIIGKIIIFREFRKEVMRQPWYQGLPAMVVTYSIAWLARNLEKQELVINLDNVWRTQICPEVLLNLLLTVSEKVNNHIHSHIGNPTTFAKGESCWKQLVDAFDKLDLAEDNLTFVAAEQAKQTEKEASEEQSALNALSDEVTISQIDRDSWIQIRQFIGNRMSPSKNNDIEKLMRGELIPDFKIKPLAKHVREYQRAGGQINFRDGFTPYSVS